MISRRSNRQKKKLVVIHFSPLELYPPAQNFLNFSVDQPGFDEVFVFTTAANSQVLSKFYAKGNLKIYRFGKSGKELTALRRYWNYFLFYSLTFVHLLMKQPVTVFYYETLSSLPALLYKKFFSKQARVFVHYHEYTSPGEYSNGMLLSRYLHRFEKCFLSKVQWLSHTNQHRMELFLTDINPIVVSHPRILPNYPPRHWQKSSVHSAKPEPLKIVYAGALSLDTMFTLEFVDWVVARKGRVTWHIYAYNLTADALKHFKTLDAENICLFEGVDYDKLPEILQQYDIGVILYKAKNANYCYNAPNKLFEYLACGLDVWFPDVMKGSLPFQTSNSYPRVIAVDFENIHCWDYNDHYKNQELSYNPSTYFLEKIYPELWKSLSESTIMV